MKYSQYLTSKDVANKYESCVEKIAKIITDLEDIKSTYEYLSQTTKDNGDPQMAIHDVIQRLGYLLAVSMVYKMQYEAEDNCTAPTMTESKDQEC